MRSGTGLDTYEETFASLKLVKDLILEDVLVLVSTCYGVQEGVDVIDAFFSIDNESELDQLGLIGVEVLAPSSGVVVLQSAGNSVVQDHGVADDREEFVHIFGVGLELNALVIEGLAVERANLLAGVQIVNIGVLGAGLDRIPLAVGNNPELVLVGCCGRLGYRRLGYRRLGYRRLGYRRLSNRRLS